MPRFNVFGYDAVATRTKALAKRSNKLLFYDSLVMGILFVVVFAAIDFIQNDFKDSSLSEVVVGILLFLPMSVGMWYFIYLLDRRFARKRLQRSKDA